MINVDDVIKEETKEHKPNWPQISDHNIINLRFLIKKNKFII